MAIIAWIISVASLLGGLALQQDAPFAHADQIANGLFAAAFLSFPPLWSGGVKTPRIMLCVAMVLALPLVLMQP